MMAGKFWTLMGVSTPFDPELKFVTSPVFSPVVLALFRLTFATYTLVTLLFVLIWEGVVTHDAETFFSYFTELTYIGLCAYFWASGVQTAAFVLKTRRHTSKVSNPHDKSLYPLQFWPRFLQVLHSLLWTTITTFPFVVTPVFWGLLAGPSTLSTRYNVWENISLHALNSVFGLFEIFLTSAGPQPWLHLPFLVVILGCYLGVAYITHATQGFYTYSFLDPKKEGAFLAVYIVGIPVAAAIIFSIVWCICWFKERLFARRNRHFQGDDVEVIMVKVRDP